MLDMKKTVFYISLLLVILLAFASKSYLSKPAKSTLSGSSTGNIKEHSTHADSIDSAKTIAPLSLKEVQDENVVVKVNIDAYNSLTMQQKLMRVLREDKDIAVDVLLALIDSGMIGVNQPMRDSSSHTARSDHYTPLYTALIANHELSVAELDEFLNRGAFINPELGAWKRAIGSSPEQISVKMLEASNMGVSEYNEMRDLALFYGNIELFEHTNLNLGEMSSESYKKFYEAMQPNYEAFYSQLQTLNNAKDDICDEDDCSSNLKKLKVMVDASEKQINQISLLLKSGVFSSDEKANMEKYLIEFKRKKELLSK